MKYLLPLIVAVFTLTACGGALNKAVQSAAYDAKPQISVENEEAFKGKKDVVIGSFLVAFNTFKTESVQAGGGILGSGFGGKSMAKSTLEGISKDLMQSITDAAYSDFTQQLEAQGYTILDRSTLLSHDSFKDTTTMDSPYETNVGGMLGGGTDIVYVSPTSLGKIRPFLGDISGVNGGFGFSNPYGAASEFADKTGTPVLHAVYLVDFANSESYGGFATETSAIQVAQGLSVAGSSTRLGLIGGYGGAFSSKVGVINLNKPISSDKEFATVSDTTGDVNKTVQTAVNIVGTLGGIGSNVSNRYTFKAKPDVYEAGALEMLKDTNQRFIAKMVSLR